MTRTEQLSKTLDDCPEMMTEKQLSKATTIPVGTLQLWRHARAKNKEGIHHGPRFLKLGSRVVYVKGDVVEWLAQQDRA